MLFSCWYDRLDHTHKYLFANQMTAQNIFIIQTKEKKNRTLPDFLEDACAHTCYTHSKKKQKNAMYQTFRGGNRIVFKFLSNKNSNRTKKSMSLRSKMIIIVVVSCVCVMCMGCMGPYQIMSILKSDTAASAENDCHLLLPVMGRR